ncbi:MAG: ABC transporter permease [Oscillospiraceae bacterium]|nr:ABC transporter permease [Oscillospiraceae bacterium]
MLFKSSKGISVIDELLLLIQESFYILLGEKRNLIISLLFPAAAGLVTVWIGGEKMFLTMEGTRAGCFILICAAIWCGLFNSIQVVVKERPNIRRDYVSGAVRISCYTTSRALVQLGLCIIQAAVLVMSIPMIGAVYENDLPEEALVLSAPLMEYYISLLLVMYAADTMGLMISCIVKSEQLASQLSPYILIVQLLFSGVLFELKDAATSVSALMLSRWGMEALGNISDLNSIQSAIAEKVPGYATPFAEAYEHTPEHLKETWLILVVFCIVPLLVGNLLLHRVDKDGRG